MSHTDSRAAAGMTALQPLAGKWHIEGQQYEGPFGPASPFVAVETFEWLDGGQFLIHRLDGHFGGRAAACVEVLGKREDGQLFAQAFYNDGKRNDWAIKEDGSTLVWGGLWSTNSEGSLHVRYTVSFEDAGNTLVGKWEHSPDGQRWQAFLDVRGTKAQPLPTTSIGGP